MATAMVVGEKRILLPEPVNWKAYEALLACWANRPVRLTYDHGRLEIMCPLHIHEQYSALIGRLVVAYCEELDLPIHTGRSTTFKKEAEQRGLEPDESFWIQNEARMRGRKEFEIQSDPPPDLAIEVDITSSSIDRMSIYAALGVAEVWRFDAEGGTIHLLQDNGRYAESEVSAALPALPLSEVMRFLEASNTLDETTWLKSFRAWVREEVLEQTPRKGKPKRRPPKK